MKTSNVAMLFAVLLLGGCFNRETVILDQTIPHRITRSVTVWVWARDPEDASRFKEQRLRVEADRYWIAHERALEE